jgi:hypothetical protein
MSSVLDPNGFDHISIFKGVLTFAMSEVINPATFVASPVGFREGSCTVLKVILPLTVVESAVYVVHSTSSVLFTFLIFLSFVLGSDFF